jgi:hypothetical protein
VPPTTTPAPPQCAAGNSLAVGFAQGCDNLILADNNNNILYSFGISSGVGGSLLNIAGSGTKATVVGTGTAASFAWPYGVLVSPDGSFALMGEQASGGVLRKIFLNNRTAIIVGTGLSEVGSIMYSGTPNIYYFLEGSNQIIAQYNDLTRAITNFVNLPTTTQGVTLVNGVMYMTQRSSTLVAMPVSTKSFSNFVTLNGVLWSQPGASPDGLTLAVPVQGSNQVALITIATKAVIYIGSGTSGNVDGSQTTARFASISGVTAAVYSSDGLYIYITQSNGYIRVINTLTLAVTTALNTGTNLAALFALTPSLCASPSQSYTCGACPSSQYFPDGACVACPIGSYCLNNAKTACPAFQTSSVNATSCFCAAGYYNNSGTCTACPAYNYCPANSASPIPCPAAQYAASQGASACVSCTAGSYCANGNITACPANANSPAGSTVFSNCTCNNGYYFDSGTQTCLACTAGSYCPGNGSQIACPTATYSAAIASVCTACTANYYCAAGLRTACPANSASPAGSTLFANCTCNGGYYLNTTTSTCVLCAKGSYCANNVQALCPTGSIAASTGLSACTY